VGDFEGEGVKGKKLVKERGRRVTWAELITWGKTGDHQQQLELG